MLCARYARAFSIYASRVRARARVKAFELTRYVARHDIVAMQIALVAVPRARWDPFVLFPPPLSSFLAGGSDGWHGGYDDARDVTFNGMQRETAAKKSLIIY